MYTLLQHLQFLLQISCIYMPYCYSSLSHACTHVGYHPASDYLESKIRTYPMLHDPSYVIPEDERKEMEPFVPLALPYVALVFSQPPLPSHMSLICLAHTHTHTHTYTQADLPQVSCSLLHPRVQASPGLQQHVDG